MPKAIVDSATIGQVWQCLDRGDRSQYPWSLSTTLSLTSLAMRTDHLAIAPGVTPAAGLAGDPLDDLLDLLVQRTVISPFRRPSAATVTDALDATKKWVGRKESIAAVQKETAAMLKDSENFGPWIDWASRKAWIPHSRRFNGLFDLEFSRYLGKILDVDEKAVRDLHKQSKDERVLKSLAKVRGDDFDDMTRAFLASVIIRGRFHEETARKEAVQLYSHPLRGLVARVGTRKAPVEFEGGRGFSCLAWLVLYGAMKQPNLSARLATWVENLVAMKGYLARGGIQLAEGSDRAVIDSAMHVAQAARIQVVSRGFEDFLALGAGLGIGVLTSVIVSPWLGVPGGVAAAQLLKKLGYPKTVSNRLAFHLHGKHLRDVAAGRLALDWQSTS